MRIIFYLGAQFCLLAVLSLSAHAATPQQECQAEKNRSANIYAACIHRATSLFKNANQLASYERRIRGCERRLNLRFRTISNKAEQTNVSCFDEPYTSANYKAEVDKHTEEIVALLGAGSNLSRAARFCRSRKNTLVGKYTICRGRAEALLATSSNSSRYDRSITRCVNSFKRKWQQVTNKVKRLGGRCFDHDRSINDYKELLDTHTDKIAKALAGSIEQVPANITLSGSPLTLAANSSASMSITNNSHVATALNVTPNLSGTALFGHVTVSSNTCSSVLPGGVCELTFTAGGTAVAATEFSIQGENTNSVAAQIAVNINNPVIAVAGSPLTLTANGAAGNMTITNTSNSATATNISADFSGTALDGNVVETGNTCANLAPSSSCTLTFTPDNTLVNATNFNIQGSNTNTITASIAIESGTTLTAVNANSGAASGGTPVTLTGTGLTGATAVTFDGIAAISVNVVNATTVTAVTPAHVAGVVDVVIDTPAGGATLADGYTYLATATGQQVHGGVIACLDGGLENLVAATADASVGVVWTGGFNFTNANSMVDGAANTTTIVVDEGGGVYAARLCDDFEIDSQGNTPCEAGNLCYADWFLPARDQLTCLYNNRIAIGGFANNGYWSSSEFDVIFAWVVEFNAGNTFIDLKFENYNARCVRSFVP